MKVPMLDLKAQLAGLREEALAAITRVVDSQGLILGPEVAAFEAELAAYLGVAHAIGVSSGTDALLVALMALGVGPGDEVVTTPFSFFATAGAVVRLGARPVFVDIDPASFNLPEAGVRAAIGKATKAIIPVHLFGRLCDLGDLYDAPGRPPIVEDGAQAIGATLRGRPMGTLGELACISFYPTKNLGAFGDAGAMVSNDAELAERVRLLRVHGAKPKYHHHLVGGNFRLDALQAAVLRVKLSRLDAWEAGRRKVAAGYDEGLAPLADRGLLVLPTAGDGKHVHNQYVVRADRRDVLRDALRTAGVETMVYYPGPLHLQPCFADLGYGPGDFPEAERACAEVLALPMYPELSAEQQAAVIGGVRDFYRI